VAESPHAEPDSLGNEAAGGYVVGVVHYRSYDDLDRCLAAVGDQKLRPAWVFVVDGDSDPEQLAAARERHPGVDFEAVANRGYAAGANHILARVAEQRPDAAFCLLLNPDVELEPEFAERLVAATRARPEVAIATGKLLRSDGRTLDSAGIELPAHRRPRDRGSQQLDRGQFDSGEYVFAASGAAMLLRCAALTDLSLDGEIFDEDFFLYHEDTDLSWRAGRLGWRVWYEPSARALHARGWRRADRFRVPVAVRRHSFKNHYLQLVKNETAAGLLRGLPLLLAWEVLRLGFVLLRDRALLPAYADAWRGIGGATRKRRLLVKRIVERRARVRE
jgi:GT2 family glycosyltransferase